MREFKHIDELINYFQDPYKERMPPGGLLHFQVSISNSENGYYLSSNEEYYEFSTLYRFEDDYHTEVKERIYHNLPLSEIIASHQIVSWYETVCELIEFYEEEVNPEITIYFDVDY